MEERTQTFDEKLELLLEEAKKKKNVLENREILNFFKGEILDPEKLDRIYDFLDNHHVDVLRTEEEDDIDPELFLDEDSEEEEEAELGAAGSFRTGRCGCGRSGPYVPEGNRQDSATYHGPGN